MTKRKLDILIIGAGASGVGVGILLKKLRFNNFLILDRNEIASSFRSWPVETRFISPSFTGNYFGVVDLNSISPRHFSCFYFGNRAPQRRGICNLSNKSC